MGMPHKSAWIADTKKLAQALRDLEESTKNCSENDLEALHMDGYLPTGVWQFLCACRVKVA